MAEQLAVVEFFELQSTHEDSRGESFILPPGLPPLLFLDRLQGVHVADTKPGFVRGNHFHARRDEVILVKFQGEWSFHWRSDHESVSARSFSGSGVLLIRVSKGTAHGLRNDGDQPLLTVSLTDGPFDSADSDTVVDSVVAP